MIETPLPQALFIEAEVGPSIVARVNGPIDGIPIPIGMLYTLAFEEDPDFATLVQVIDQASQESGIAPVDFNLPGGPLLMVEPQFPAHDPGKGLRLLQLLFQPRIPRSALVYEMQTSGDWQVQITVLGGSMPQEDIAMVIAGIEAGGGTVTDVTRSRLDADVFFTTVPVRSARGRRGFMNSLQQSCGIFARIQEWYE